MFTSLINIVFGSNNKILNLATLFTDLLNSLIGDFTDGCSTFWRIVAFTVILKCFVIKYPESFIALNNDHQIYISYISVKFEQLMLSYFSSPVKFTKDFDKSLIVLQTSPIPCNWLLPFCFTSESLILYHQVSSVFNNYRGFGSSLFVYFAMMYLIYRDFRWH